MDCSQVSTISEALFGVCPKMAKKVNRFRFNNVEIYTFWQLTGKYWQPLTEYSDRHLVNTVKSLPKVIFLAKNEHKWTKDGQKFVPRFNEISTFSGPYGTNTPKSLSQNSKSLSTFLLKVNTCEGIRAVDITILEPIINIIIILTMGRWDAETYPHVRKHFLIFGFLR